LPPEFFLDRNLGRRVAEGLTACGWTVHRIGDAFPDDGQDVPDEEWITYGLDRSWVPLSKDGRIKTRDLEIRPVLEREAVLFWAALAQPAHSPGLHSGRPERGCTVEQACACWVLDGSRVRRG
jgi:hypothetical protein